MKKSIAMKWVKALRSGKYKKGKLMLRDLKSRPENNDEYCCLGVLCDISQKGIWKSGLYKTENSADFISLPGDVRTWAGMKTSIGKVNNTSLVYLNDQKAKSFRMIANFIEKNYKKL